MEAAFFPLLWPVSLWGSVLQHETPWFHKKRANHQTKTTPQTTKTDETLSPGQICVSPKRNNSEAKQGTQGEVPPYHQKDGNGSCQGWAGLWAHRQTLPTVTHQSHPEHVQGSLALQGCNRCLHLAGHSPTWLPRWQVYDTLAHTYQVFYSLSSGDFWTTQGAIWDVALTSAWFHRPGNGAWFRLEKRSRHVDLPCFIGCNLDPPNKVVLVGRGGTIRVVA